MSKCIVGIVAAFMLTFASAALAQTAWNAGKALGPNLSVEFGAAGVLGLPFAWGPDGRFTFDATMTVAQVNAVKAVVSAHDAATPYTAKLVSIVGVRSLSVTIAGTATTAAVTFLRALDDANYEVHPAVNAFSGTPPVGAFVCAAIDLTTTGFTVRCATAPGLGNSVTVRLLAIKLAP